MKYVSRFFFTLALLFSIQQAFCFEFSENLISEALKEVDFSGDKSIDEMVDFADQKLTPLLEEHLIPVMLYPWVSHVSSLSPVVFSLPDFKNPDPARSKDFSVFGIEKLIRYHLRTIMVYCVNHFSEDYTFDDETNVGLIIDLHNRLLERLQPKLEAAYERFWEISQRYM